MEQVYGKTREKWWWHDSTFTYWFERLKDDRLKLTLELGPIESEQRLFLLERLENAGLSTSTRSKLPSAKYTRLFSESKVISDWENVDEVYDRMKWLYEDVRNKDIIEKIEMLV